MNSIIIPVKSLEIAKLRLKSILNAEQRKQLCINMFKDVVKAASSTQTANEIMTVSSDPSILEMGSRFGSTIFEETETNINSSINSAINLAIKKKSDSILIIPGDIPLITSRDIDIIFDYKISTPSIIISPSFRKNGTNLLYLHPPNVIQIQYGENSFQKHVEKAKEINKINIIIHDSKNIELDIDLPEDLFNFLKTKSNTLTYKYLNGLNLDITQNKK